MGLSDLRPATQLRDIFVGIRDLTLIVAGVKQADDEWMVNLTDPTQEVQCSPLVLKASMTLDALETAVRHHIDDSFDVKLVDQEGRRLLDRYSTSECLSILFE